jgi:hypothetical protein
MSASGGFLGRQPTSQVVRGLHRYFFLLRSCFLDSWRGLGFRGTGAACVPFENIHESIPPLLPEAWSACRFFIRRSHSFPRFWLCFLVPVGGKDFESFAPLAQSSIEQTSLKADALSS